MPPKKQKTATLRRRAAQARADAIRLDQVAAAEERLARETAARLAALSYGETPLLYRNAEIIADGRAVSARYYRRRATAAKRRATLADKRLAERLAEEERPERLAEEERLNAAAAVYRARLVAAGCAPIPEDDAEREAMADAVEALLGDPSAMLGNGDANALGALLRALGRGDLVDD